MRSAMVGLSITALRDMVGCSTLVPLTFHKLLVALDRAPCMIIFPLKKMYTLVALKYAVHPESHNFPSEMRAPDASDSKRCTFRAAMGRIGRFSTAS